MHACSVLACVAAVLVATGVPAGTAATSATVVGATVVSATSINATACGSFAVGTTSFGSVVPGSQVVTSNDCNVRFGSSNDTSQLRLAQSDGLGVGMWAPTVGRVDAAYDGPLGGGNGAFSVPMGAAADEARDSLVQPDGKVVVAGRCDGPVNSDACVARLMLDGSLDPTFDGPGAPGDGRFLFSYAGGGDDVQDLAIQPDGKLLVAGTCGGDFCIARLLADGSLDPTFDGPSGTGNGVAILVLPGSQSTAAAIVHPEGRLTIAGTCDGVNFCAARLHADGTFDTTFDGPAGIGNGFFWEKIGPVWGGNVVDADLQADGKVVVLGHCANPLNMDLCLVRYDETGAHDVTFDGPDGGSGDGSFLSHYGSDDYASDMLLQPDGRIVTVGTCVVGDLRTCVSRFNVDGSLDANFDGPSGSANGEFVVNTSYSRAYAASVDLQPDGKLLVASSCGWPGTLDVCVYRLNPTGERDVAFDGPSGTGNGEVGYAFVAGDDQSAAIAQRPDGRVIVAGTCANANSDFCMLALDNAGTIDDYVTGGGSDRDWSSGSGTGFFATCLRAVSGGSSAVWAMSDPCPTSDGAFWRAVPTTSTLVAHNTGLEPDPADATAHLRFAMRAATTQSPGAYVAPITFEVLAPGT